jgi:hypothetical protein
MDPRLGRFLTPDPIVSKPSYGQSWNPFAYVLNSPLNYTDPGGFQEQVAEDPNVVRWDGDKELHVWVFGEPRKPRAPEPEREPEKSADVGAWNPPTDLRPIGNSAGYSPEPPPTATELPNGVGPVSRSLQGGLDAINLITWEATKFALLNTATLGGYATFQLWGSILQGYMEMGPVGAINAINPLYHIGKGGAQTYLHAARGDYRAATCAGVLTGVTMAATIGGVMQGLASLAGKPPTGAGFASSGGQGGAAPGRYVYQLVDEVGDPVYYGISNNPLRRLGEHASDPPGPFRGMQVISDPLPNAQARSLETSLIQQAQSEGRWIYNESPVSISPLNPVETPLTVPPNATLLNPKLYTW